MDNIINITSFVSATNIMIGYKLCAILVSMSITGLHAHSWVECSDYDPVSFDYDKLGNFDRARCRGYPRAFQRQFDAGFAIDTGYNNEYDNCERYPYSANDYSDKIPMAKLQAGQVLYISHPTKNHVADTCTNPFIPSTSMKVKMSSKPGVDTFDIELAMVGEDHVNGNIDHLGYQRCYNFCENPDKSHCLTAWTLPSSIPDGQYSFIWEWQFNSQQFYSNCFDAIIGSGGASTPVSSSASGSVDAVVNDTVIEPLPSVVPTPATTTITSDPDISSSFESSSGSVTIVDTPTPSVEEPVESNTPAPTAEVVSSGASIENPIASLTRYIMGSFNVTGLFNITMTEFNDAARALRNLNQ